MRLAKKSRRIVLAILIWAVIPAATVSAFVWGERLWPDAQAVMSLHPISFPAGSTWDAWAQDAMYRWNEVQGSQMTFLYNRDSDSCFNHDDNDSQVCFVNGGIGENTYARAYYETYAGILMEGCDILFDVNVNWTSHLSSYSIENDPYGNPSIVNFHGIMQHELGHCLGLDHNIELSTMNEFYSHAQYNLWSDDRAATRAIYGGSGSERNLTVSNWKAGVTPMVPAAKVTPTTVSAGSTLTIEFSIENSGTQDENGVRLGYYLSTNSIISSADRLIDAEYWNFPYHSQGTFSRTLTIPADVQTGVYYVGFYLDDLQAVPERDENDNRLAHFTPIFVGGDYIEVPFDTSNLSEAVGAVRNGGTVMVYPGIYNSNITANNKTVTVVSALGPSVTKVNSHDIVIDPPWGPPINLYLPAAAAYGNANLTLDGFELQYSGIRATVWARDNALININNSIIRAGDTDAVKLQESSLISISNSEISAPVANGIVADGTNATINLINSAVYASGQDGLNLTGGSANLRNNTITGNAGDAIDASAPATVQARNNILTFNGGYGLRFSGSVAGSHAYNNVYGNLAGSYLGTGAGTGEIGVDPLFSDADFHLSPESACLDAGDPSDPYYFEPEPNGDRINMGRFGGTPDAALSILNCQIHNVAIYPQCGSNGCEQGELVVMYAETSGDACSYSVDHFQIDAFHNDCQISFSGADMQGIDASRAEIEFGNNSIVAVWSVPYVPTQCRGKTLDATWAAIRIGGPPGVGQIISDTWASGELPFRSYNGSCFAGDTLISMADGTQKPISQVSAGDKVTAWDLEASAKVEAQVLDTIKRDSPDYYLLNGSIRVTAEHPFFSNGKWVPVKDLELGATLKTISGDKVILISKELIKEPLEVYNISVDKFENYFAAGVLVHNKRILHPNLASPNL